ncbi:flagellar protein FlgN [Aliidiomarina halalkaliphila]|uniref:Flagellar protein FlgN n=1 Tax=Aliidiomarina halalkaliphila TaxID=2593535 RepID=A0A552X178_9GAMM|nr:flagellar protein FlgN [Aliidiomarina halalkaliphila]TRW48801.1 flagellar protein FlgN [Aliidiomarina halalkaliphila]
MSLQALLEQQQHRLESLLSLLQREQSLLGEGAIDGDQLGELAKAKQKLFVELEKAESSRRSVQTRLGYDLDTQGSQKAAADAGCASHWQRMLELTEQVAHLNSLNGELIAHRLQHNQHMLNLLRDAAGSSLYGPDGQAQKNRRRVNSRA